MGGGYVASTKTLASNIGGACKFLHWHKSGNSDPMSKSPKKAGPKRPRGRPPLPAHVRLIKNTYRADRHGKHPRHTTAQKHGKRLLDKRLLDDATEVVMWSELFQDGDDFCGDLEPLGLNGNGHADPATRAAAQKAWSRLGALYLRDIWPMHPHHKPCWALEQFGLPPGHRRVRPGLGKTAMRSFGRFGE
jgi:hypothetical protein